MEATRRRQQRPYADEERAMTPSSPPDTLRQRLLEEVLKEYMERLDRGEGADQEQLLAGHPELAEELRSYFAGVDEVARLAQPAPEEAPRLPLARTSPEPGQREE